MTRDALGVAREGLDSVLPARQLYVEALGAWSSLGGPLVRLEGGARVTDNVGAFAFGEARPGVTGLGLAAGAGVRVTW